MTEYTVDKDGNVTSKGDGKKPINLKQLAIDAVIPQPLQKPISKIVKRLKKGDFFKKAKPKIKPKPKPPKPIKPKPKPVRKAKGGMIIAPKSGSAHYKSKQSAKSIAKKYFKGGMN